jgi:hypothetical protein
MRWSKMQSIVLPTAGAYVFLVSCRVLSLKVTCWESTMATTLESTQKPSSTHSASPPTTAAKNHL